MTSLNYLQLKNLFKMDIYIENLQHFAGKGVSISENKKSVAKRDKKYFISMVDTLSKLDDRTSMLMELGMDLVKYEDPYFQLIESLIIKSYGSLKGGIILWWCGERKLLDTTHYNMIDEEGNATMVSNVNQLYNYLNKIK
jgi:hypothetical protein